MKIYIDLAKQAITNTTDEKVYEGDFYSNVFEVLFYNYEDENWFPTMSQLAPNGREAGDFTADALGVGESHTYVEDGTTYLRFTFTMGATWVLMKGKSNFYIWMNRLNGTVLKKCVGMVNVMIDQSTDNYFIADVTFNPNVKAYIDSCIDEQNEVIAQLGTGAPKYFDTAANIALLEEDKGLAVATDTGHLYYWNVTEEDATKYKNSGLQYTNLSAYYTKTQSDNTFAPKSTAITHTGSQLQDYSGNNLFPRLGNENDLYNEEANVKKSNDFISIDDTDSNNSAIIETSSNSSMYVQNSLLTVVGAYASNNGMELVYDYLTQTFTLSGTPNTTNTISLRINAFMVIPSDDAYFLQVDRDIPNTIVSPEKIQICTTLVGGSNTAYLVWNETNTVKLNTNGYNAVLLYLNLDTAKTYNIQFKLRITNKYLDDFYLQEGKTIHNGESFTLLEPRTNILVGNYGNVYEPSETTKTSGGLTLTYLGNGLYHITGTPTATTVTPIINCNNYVKNQQIIYLYCGIDKNHISNMKDFIVRENTTNLAYYSGNDVNIRLATVVADRSLRANNLSFIFKNLSTSTNYDFYFRFLAFASNPVISGLSSKLYFNDNFALTNFIKNKGIVDFANIKNTYRFLALSFIGTGKDTLVLLASNNLAKWDLLKYNLMHITEGLAMRDPAVIKIGDYFYITYGLWAYSSGDTIGFTRTKDFVNFEELASLQVTNGIENAYQVWSPDWFRDGDDIYIVAGYRTGTSDNITNHCIVCKYNVSNHTLDNGVYLNGTSSTIDIHIYKENGNYYAIGSGPALFKASSLFGTYTNITPQISSTGEGQYAVKFGNKWVLFMQYYKNANNNYKHNIVYLTGSSLEGFNMSSASNWKDVIYDSLGQDYQSKVKGNFTHWTIYDLYEDSDNNNNFI